MPLFHLLMALFALGFGSGLIVAFTAPHEMVFFALPADQARLDAYELDQTWRNIVCGIGALIAFASFGIMFFLKHKQNTRAANYRKDIA